MKKQFLVVLIFFAVTLPAVSQTPRFEVVSIKPSRAGTDSSNLNFGRDRVEFLNLSLESMLQFAYGLNPGSEDQIIGGASWVRFLRYDVVAKEDEQTAAVLGRLSEEDRTARLREMTRGFLESRFQLQVKQEERQLPVLALTIARGGEKVAPAATSGPEKAGDGRANEEWSGLHNDGQGHVEGRGIGLQPLVQVLSTTREVGGRLVVDMTGLKGKYDFKLNWMPEQASGTAAPDGPSLFSALQEQLGLKLESRKAPVECVVIEKWRLPARTRLSLDYVRKEERARYAGLSLFRLTNFTRRP